MMQILVLAPPGELAEFIVRNATTVLLAPAAKGALIDETYALLLGIAIATVIGKQGLQK